MNNDIAIKIEGLTKVYKIFDRPIDRVKEALNPFHKRYSKDFYALNDVSFEIKKGETVGIIGKNGAGKSTLLKIITGVLTPTGGSVEVNGRIASLLELGAGFNPEMTGIENIYMNGSVMGYGKKEMDEKIDAIIDFADIGDFIHQPVKMYSSGMFARLAFAMNSTLEPDVLIVDEALAVGDMAFQIKCMDKMDAMMKGGCTIIFVSHDINAVRRLCHKALFLHQGSIVAYGEVNLISDIYIDAINKEKIDTGHQNAYKKSSNSNDIANIVSFNVLNSKFQSTNVFSYDEEVNIKIQYEVYDSSIMNPVLGVALFDVSKNYICGLNTLLDKYSIPWREGINTMYLKYPIGLMVSGGEYCFDVALEDKTATILFEYIRNIKQIRITSPYVSEGLLTIKHSWEDSRA